MPTDDDTPRPWPPAQRGGTAIIQHPAWEEARNAVLDLAAEGPVTVALVGAPGTGKTWLLRELAGCLGDHGFPTMVLMQGDLPMTLSDGAALLVDEASRMSGPVLSEMAAQRRGVVVLADVERFQAVMEALPPGPVLIRVRSLEADEVAAFTSAWLRQAGAKVAIDADGLSRLTAQGDGIVRLIVQLLGAALAQARDTGAACLTGPMIDQVAEMRLGGLIPPAEAVPAAPGPAEPIAEPEYAIPAFAVTAVPEPDAMVVQPFVGPRARRRRAIRWALVGSAIAACALGWAFLPGLAQPALTQSAEIAAPTLAARPADATPPPLPPLQRADIAEPGPVLAQSPAASEAQSVALAGLPQLRNADIPKPALAAEPPPAETVAIAAPPALVPDVVPTTGAAPASEAALAIPAVAPRPVPRLATVRGRGGAGLALVAQQGDTLERLYDDIYRNRQAPPYEDVVAANPHPFKPGVIVVFPEPLGGWNRVQR